MLAVASIYRDKESLLIEAAMERGDDAEVERLLARLKRGHRGERSDAARNAAQTTVAERNVAAAAPSQR